MLCYYHRPPQVSKSVTKLIIFVCVCSLIRCLNLRLIKCSGNVLQRCTYQNEGFLKARNRGLCGAPLCRLLECLLRARHCANHWGMLCTLYTFTAAHQVQGLHTQWVSRASWASCPRGQLRATRTRRQMLRLGGSLYPRFSLTCRDVLYVCATGSWIEFMNHKLG